MQSESSALSNNGSKDGSMSISLLGANEIRELASSLDLRPTKKLGQNFVIDGNVCQKIVRTANVTQNDCVLEIGPGLGSLTLAIAQIAKNVVAVEIDSRLASLLPKTLIRHGAENVQVIARDAMDLMDLPLPATKLVANLPYNVSVPVLLRMLELFPTITSGVVMVQTEVAERLAAKPGTKIYGAPSAKAAWWADLSLAGNVSRSVFWPVPNVDSSLVAFERHLTLGDESARVQTFDIIDDAFSQRRKMLRKVLSKHFGGSEATERHLSRIGIDSTLRGESLAITDFYRIAEYARGL